MHCFQSSFSPSFMECEETLLYVKANWIFFSFSNNTSAKMNVDMYGVECSRQKKKKKKKKNRKEKQSFKYMKINKVRIACMNVVILFLFKFLFIIFICDLMITCKVVDLSRGWPEGSLFKSYYTEA